MQVKRWCETLDIPHYTLVWTHDTISSGMQEKARHARYAIMRDWCLQHGISHLLTAHHADDQIETMLFRLLRGSQLEGMAGIMPVSGGGGITLHRPLLGLYKSQLIHVLQEAKQPYVIDPSNHSLRYSRNALRAELEQLTTTQRNHVIKLSNFLHGFRNSLENRLAESLDLCWSLDVFGFGTLNRDAFLAQPKELKWRIVQYICQLISGNGEPLRSEKIAYLVNALHTSESLKQHTLHGAVFSPTPKQDGWLVLREKNRIEEKKLLQQGSQLWDGRFVVTLNEPTETPMFIGALGTSSAMFRPLLEKSGLPKAVWPTIPAVFTLEECRFIPHITPCAIKLRFVPAKLLAAKRFFAM